MLRTSHTSRLRVTGEFDPPDAPARTGSTVSVQLANGSHTVTLAVQDAIGATASVTKTITIGTARKRAVKH